MGHWGFILSEAGKTKRLVPGLGLGTDLLQRELVGPPHVCLGEPPHPVDVVLAEAGLYLAHRGQLLLGHLEPVGPRRPDLQLEQDRGVLWTFINLISRPAAASLLNHRKLNKISWKGKTFPDWAPLAFCSVITQLGIISFNFYEFRFTHESSEHEDDADDDESLDCCQPVSFGDLAGDAVEDVDEAEEDGDEDSHAAGDALGRHEEADPGDDDEHAGGEVVGDDVERHLASQRQLESRHGVIA